MTMYCCVPVSAQYRTPQDMCCCSGSAVSTEAFATKKIHTAFLGQPFLASEWIVTVEQQNISIHYVVHHLMAAGNLHSPFHFHSFFQGFLAKLAKDIELDAVCCQFESYLPLIAFAQRLRSCGMAWDAIPYSCGYICYCKHQPFLYKKIESLLQESNQHPTRDKLILLFQSLHMVHYAVDRLNIYLCLGNVESTLHLARLGRFGAPHASDASAALPQ